MLEPLRRGTIALAAAFGLLVGLTTAADAGELPVSGSFSGTGQFVQEPCVLPSGPNVGHTVDATATLSGLGPSDIDLVVCAGPTGVDAFGDFTVANADGTVAGEMTGTIGGGIPVYFEHLVLTITNGTGDFEGATGTLTVDQTMTLVFPLQIEGTISGAITVPARTPTSKDDCKNGGWQDYEDDNGVPFRNQGECIAWVNHH